MSKKKVVVHDVPPPDDEDFEAWRYDDDLPVPDLRAPGGTMTQNRVGDRVTPVALPHHRTCGSAYGGSCLLGK